jgi:hypothetical protein
MELIFNLKLSNQHEQLKKELFDKNNTNLNQYFSLYRSFSLA